jgi:hypothetical protein
MSARKIVRTVTAALAAALFPFSAAALDPPAALDAVVGIEGVRAEGDAIAATLENRGARELRDVRLLVQWVYDWPDEFHPGDASLGRAWVHVVPGPIAPGGREPFVFHPPGGLPSGPGRFEARAQVLGFTEVGE